MRIRAGVLWQSIGFVALALTACNENPTVAPASVSTDMATTTVPSTDMATGTTQVMNASVTLMDNFYTPASVTISRGGTVAWTWAGANPHTVTSNTGVFDSSPAKTTGTFSFTFPNAGTFPYHCLVHGFAMSGTVTVQ